MIIIWDRVLKITFLATPEKDLDCSRFPKEEDESTFPLSHLFLRLFQSSMVEGSNIMFKLFFSVNCTLREAIFVFKVPSESCAHFAAVCLGVTCNLRCFS